MGRKRQPHGDRPPRRRPEPTEDMPLPDPRARERVLRELVQSLHGEAAGPDTPQGRAQTLLDQAFAEPDGKRRVQLAKDALAVWPDCADAHVLLAEHAASRKQELALYQQGVAAGERALGAEAFQQYVGRFWGVLETRPYMRARLGLAHALWALGRRDVAVGHLQEMLRLNPNDNQGARNTLAGFLLALDRDDDLAGLLQQYPDEGTAAWAYTRALLAFRKQGDTIEARQLLKTARKTNEHVPDYLLGKKFPPAKHPDHYSPGQESEALVYLGSFLVGWKNTAGAVAWLRENVKAKKKQADAPHPKGPLGFVKKWLKDRLDQEDDVWQADCRQTPNWLQLGGEFVRPWTILVTNRSTGQVLAHQLLIEAPSTELVWDTLVQAMQHPAAGEPHRPLEMQVLPGEPWASLKTHLQEVGILVAVRDELDHLDAVFGDMCEHVCGRPRPGLLDAPGVTPERVASFYDAAATYFQQAPWKKVGYEAAVQVECERFRGPYYAVLMGQSGLTTGLALYDDLKILRRSWARNHEHDEETARETTGTSVTYGEEWEIPVADLDAVRKYGWRVARPDAYPSVFHKERGRSMRPPLNWELELMEGCLRAVPEFVNRRRQDDPAREELTVPSAAGELKMVLSWVGDEEGK